jgi:hypothetical protein
MGWGMYMLRPAQRSPEVRTHNNIQENKTIGLLALELDYEYELSP